MENFKIFKPNNRFFLLFIIIFCIFVLGKNVFASYSENFDSYATGSLNNTANWDEYLGGGTMYVVNNVYYSPSRAVYGPGLSVSNNYDASSTLSFWVYISDGEEGSGFAGRVNFLSTSTSHELCGAGFTYTSGENFNVKNYPNNDTITSLSINTWHKIGIRQDINFFCYIQATSTDWVNVGQLSVSLQHAVEQIGIRGIEAANYIDNINTDQRGVDSIEFITPEENGIYNYSAPITSPNYFNWHTRFSFSTTTAALYPDDYAIVSISFEKPGSFMPTIFEMDDLFNMTIEFYVENPESAFLIDRNNAHLPTEEGEYTVIATLWNSYYSSSQGKFVLDKLLATAQIDKFTITSATTTPPTAWCANRCSDIATATDLLGQIGNGVNCALRSAACYMFNPHDFAINGVLDQAAIIQTKFPASTFFDLTNAIASATQSTTFDNSTFGFPGARKTGTSTEFYIIPVISSSTLSDYVGTANANNIRLGFTTFLYCLTGILIILILI